MPTKTVSTQQKKAVVTGATLLEVNAAGPVVIYDIEGDVTSTNGTNYYIQLLGVSNPVTGTTVPLYSRLAVLSGTASGINGFSFVYRPGGLDTATLTNPAGGSVATTGANNLPVYVAISSTDNVWTSVAANTQVSVDFEDTYAEFEIPNQTIVGDKTTGVDSLAVWTANGPQHLLTQVVYSNSAATTNAPMYLMLFGYAGPAAGATPLQEWTVTDNNFHTLKFGNGFAVQQGNPTTYVLGYNCYLYGSSTPLVYTATVATAWTMQAFIL
jgi:hypothetical protein